MRIRARRGDAVVSRASLPSLFFDPTSCSPCGGKPWNDDVPRKACARIMLDVLTHPGDCAATVQSKRGADVRVSLTSPCQPSCTSQTSMPGITYLRPGGRKDGTRGCCLDCRYSISHCDSAPVFLRDFGELILGGAEIPSLWRS